MVAKERYKSYKLRQFSRGSICETEKNTRINPIENLMFAIFAVAGCLLQLPPNFPPSLWQSKRTLALSEAQPGGSFFGSSVECIQMELIH